MQRQAFTVMVLLVIFFFAGILFTRSEEEARNEGTRGTTVDAGSDTTVGVRLFTPGENALVGSPVHLAGEARGKWYFEASFPIRIYDADGVLLAEGTAQTAPQSGAVAVETFVPFTATLFFSASTTADTGTIVLANDNPSGDPAKAESLIVPIRLQISK